MNDEIPTVEAEAPRAEDLRLRALADKLEVDQLAFLDEAGKRVVELSSLMLGLLFGVLALGSTFPPPFLATQPRNQGLALAALALYLLALGAGIFAVQPRSYKLYRANLTRLQGEIDRMANHKRFWFTAGTWLLAGASLCLGALVAAIILSV
jgi:hypothetical protein